MAFPQVVTDFRSTVEDLTEALDPLKLQDEPLSKLRSYLHSGSNSIVANSESIFSISSTGGGSSFRSEELVQSMLNATKFLQLKQFGPKDASSIATMHLRINPSASTIDGDPISSLQIVERHFSKISDIQYSIIQRMTDSPGPLDEAGKLVLDCLKAAFFSSLENPLWLVKSKKNPFPNLSSLPAPPLDASRDSVRLTMEQCCKAWADTHDLNSLVKRAIVCLESSSDNALVAAKDIKLKPNDGDLRKTMKNLVSRLEDAKEFIALKGQTRFKPLRVAVVGYMSHGKSSFINSLIGQHLIVSEAKASTSCPMIIKHVDRQFEPTLHINSEHFMEYLYTLRKVGLLPSDTDARVENIKLQHARRSTALTERQKANLLLFAAGFKFEAVYRGQKEILKAQGMINDLIRLCAIFSSYVQEPDESPKPKNREWPELHVHMSEMAPLKEAFELVDLPGFGDKLSKDTANFNILEQNHRDVLKTVDGVILVTALLDNEITCHSLSTMSYGRNELESHQAPLLLAVGTKVDLQREGENWSLDSEIDFFQETFKSETSARLTKTSPGLYIDALHAKKYFASVPDNSRAPPDQKPNSSSAVDSVEPLTVPRASLLTLKKTDPITYTALWRSYHFGANYKTPEEDSREYANLTTVELRKMMQRIIESCNYQDVRSRLEEYVVHGGRYRSLLREMATFIPYVDRVLEAEAATLRTSHGGEIVRKAIERRCQEFPEKMRAICQRWKISKETDLGRDTSKIVDSAMVLVTKQAAAALESVISKKYKEYAMVPSRSQFKDVDQGISFLVAVEKALKAELNMIQDETVKAIRLHARDVWSTSIQDLRKRVNDTLIGDNKKSFNEMGEALASDLKDLSAEAINGQVQQEIEDIIAEKLRLARPEAQLRAITALQTTGMAAIRAAEQTLFSAFRRRKGVDQQFPSQAPAPVNPASLTGNADDQNLINALGVKSQNDLGFLIRAPVLASAVEGPITREIWPWIASPPGKPIFISSDRVKQQYNDMVLAPWEKILRKECKVSLEGAIRLSITRGNKCVEEAIRSKADELGVLRDSSETLSQDALEQVNLLRVNALSSRKITHIACRNMYEKLAASDELSRLSLPEIL